MRGSRRGSSAYKRGKCMFPGSLSTLFGFLGCGGLDHRRGCNGPVGRGKHCSGSTEDGKSKANGLQDRRHSVAVPVEKRTKGQRELCDRRQHANDACARRNTPGYTRPALSSPPRGVEMVQEKLRKRVTPTGCCEGGQAVAAAQCEGSVLRRQWH